MRAFIDLSVLLAPLRLSSRKVADVFHPMLPLAYVTECSSPLAAEAALPTVGSLKAIWIHIWFRFLAARTVLPRPTPALPLSAISHQGLPPLSISRATLDHGPWSHPFARAHCVLLMPTSCCRSLSLTALGPAKELNRSVR